MQYVNFKGRKKLMGDGIFISKRTIEFLDRSLTSNLDQDYIHHTVLVRLSKA